MPLNHTTPYAQLTDRQFELLGRVVVEWANLEFLLGCLLNRLLRTPEFLGRTYTEQLSAFRIEVAIRQAIDVHHIRYRSRIVSDETQAAILRLLARIQGKRALRNKLAHFCWMRSTDDAIFGTSFSGGQSAAKLRSSSVSLTTAELVEAHQEVSEIVDELQAVVIALHEMTEEEAFPALRPEA